MPANTPTANLPYPLLSDAPADLEAAVKPLALALDPLMLTAAEKAALVGGAVAPGPANKFVTQQDAQLLMPVGTVLPYAGSALPPGSDWAWADGSLIVIAGHEALYGVVGHAYNGGLDPGGGFMRLPDKRGRVPMGADNFGVGAAGRLPNTTAKGRGQGGGAEQHTLSTAQLPAHTHPDTIAYADVGAHSHQGVQQEGVYQPWIVVANGSVSYSGIRAGSQGPDSSYLWKFPMGVGQTGASATVFGYGYAAPAGGHGHTRSGGVGQNLGGGGAHPNLQPYEVDTYIVRVT